MENLPLELGTNALSRRLTINLNPSRCVESAGGPLNLLVATYQHGDEPIDVEIEFEEENEITVDNHAVGLFPPQIGETNLSATCARGGFVCHARTNGTAIVFLP